ncbi:MAG: type IV secretion system DNA-binding domain-containing protein [Petrotogales bacterium]
MNNSKIWIGEAKSSNGKTREIYVSADDLFRHQYVIGATGSGKSTLIENEVLEAFRKGYCTWVLDPHGDLSIDILEATYPEDLNRVLLLDPLKVGFSMNPFELPKYEGKEQREMMVERLIGEVVSFMKRLYGKNYWGPSLNRVFQNALRRLYRNDDSPTFEEMLKLVKGELDKDDYKDFYRELDKLPKGRTDSVINKLEPFVRNDMLRRIFCSKVSTVDIEELLKGNKLVLWRLAKGELSELNAGLIGSALITKLWLAIVSKRKDERNPVFLAIDEFQNFARMNTLGTMITEGRKYRIGMLLAHQHTGQIPKEILGDVLGNTATQIFFRVSKKDAKLVANYIGFDRNRVVKALTSLPDGKAVVKLRSGFGERPVAPFEISTPEPPYKKHNFTEKLIERMRTLYSMPKLPQQTSFKSDADKEIIELLRTVHSIEESGEETTRTNLSRSMSVPGSKLSDQLDRAQSKGLVERVVKKEGRGRPKVLTHLTEKGKKAIGIGVSSGSSAKAGGELHRALLFKAKEWLERQSYQTRIPEQAGREKQPDLIAKKDSREIAVEVETSANHPEQIKKNYEKNVKLGRFVVFVVHDKNLRNKLDQILNCYKKGKYEIYIVNTS